MSALQASPSYQGVSEQQRLQLLMELGEVCPMWLTVKELAGKGKLIKVANNVTPY